MEATHTMFVAVLALASTAISQVDGRTVIPLGLPAEIPIHSPYPGDQGTWAGGANYKVRLDGGFEFVPVLGAERPHNLPLAWRTESVSVGAADLLRGAVPEERAIAEQRYEYRWTGVIEAYDMRAESVEQTFRIERAPHGPGELLVRGRIETELLAEPMVGRHAALRFVDADGVAVLEYGAATAIDARGRKFPMTTSFDGSRIELSLASEVVARAEFPILVDPVIIVQDPARAIGMTAIAVLPSDSAHSHMLLITRASSATDHDVFGYLSSDGFTFGRLAYVDAGTTDGVRVAVAGVTSTGTFVVAHERRQGLRTDLLVYVQPRTSTLVNQGTALLRTSVSGEHFRNPAVGGVWAGSVHGIVVFDHAVLTNNHTIDGLRVDTIARTATDLPSFGAVPTETMPAITPAADPSWIVCWNDQVGNDRRVLARKVLSTGLVQLQIGTLRSSTSEAMREVKVAGGGGEFVATWRSTPTSLGVNGIRALRFEWPDGVGTPTVGASRFIAGGATGYVNLGIAFDHAIRSQWLALHTENDLLARNLYATRLGWTGGLVAASEPHGSGADRPFAGSVAFDRNPGGEDEFSILYATEDARNTVYGQVFAYPAEVYVHTPFGGGCGSSQSEAHSASIAGRTGFRLRLSAPLHTPAAIAIGTLAANLPLDAIGMPGCVLMVEPALATFLPGVPDSGGANQVTLTLPDAPTFLGFVYTQWLYLTAGANPLGVVTNDAFVHEVR